MREYLGERAADRLGNQRFIDQRRDIASVTDPRREAVRELAHEFGLRPSNPTDSWLGYGFLEHLNQSQGGNYILERWQRRGSFHHQCVGSGSSKGSAAMFHFILTVS